jgi:hypothetical protein
LALAFKNTARGFCALGFNGKTILGLKKFGLLKKMTTVLNILTHCVIG